MSEEAVPQPIKNVAVCGHCFEHSSEGFVLEWNFKDKTVYFVCPKCRKMNEMGFRPKTAQPYPSARLMR